MMQLYIYSLLSGFVAWTGTNLPYLSTLIRLRVRYASNQWFFVKSFVFLIIIEVFKNMSAYNIAHPFKEAAVYVKIL